MRQPLIFGEPSLGSWAPLFYHSPVAVLLTRSAGPRRAGVIEAPPAHAEAMRVFTIVIVAPQPEQTIGARSLTHAEARRGTNFSPRGSNGIKRLQLGCKPKTARPPNPLRQRMLPHQPTEIRALPRPRLQQRFSLETYPASEQYQR